MAEYALVSFVLGVVGGILMRLCHRLTTLLGFGFICASIGARGLRGYVESFVTMEAAVICVGFFVGFPFGYLTTDWIAKWLKSTPNDWNPFRW